MTPGRFKRSKLYTLGFEFPGMRVICHLSALIRQGVHRFCVLIDPDPSQPTYIETIPEIGYGFALPSAQ